MSRSTVLRYAVAVSTGGAGGVPVRVALLGAFREEAAAQRRCEAWRRRVHEHGPAPVDVTVLDMFAPTGAAFAAIYSNMTGAELRR